MADIVLYDLAGADDRLRWSPFCWRAKLALAHKGLATTTVPWHYFQKDVFAPSESGDVPRVPVLVDEGRWVSDSWRIALYLEERYPDRAPLFDGARTRDLALFLKHWLDTDLHPHLIRITLLDMYQRLHPLDQSYFRDSREKRFGMALEEVAVEKPSRIVALREALAPVRRTLQEQAFLGGDEPFFADFLVVSSLLWGSNACEHELLEDGDPVARWRDTLFESYERAVST